MLPKKVVAKCPYDACPMQAFAVREASLGYTISLHGCGHCKFNLVFAFATDADGNTRPVASCRLDPASGAYTLKEHGSNPPDWIDLTRAALPSTAPREPKGKREST